MNIDEIAVIRTDFTEKFGIPRQSGLVSGLMGRIVFKPEYRTADAIRGLEGYSHLWLIWGFSKSFRSEATKWSATVTPPRLGGKKRVGVFATRSPFRPNPLGLSCVKIEEIRYDDKNGAEIIVSGIDMLDRTPIYDIKPYLPYADCQSDAVGGFADQVYSHQLTVIIPDDLDAMIQERDRTVIRQLLMQDPRTAFIHDESRVWGISYADYNIRFTVKEDILTVCEITTQHRNPC